MPKYDPLCRYLLNVSVDEMRLSFTDIERILGTPLPFSARRHQPWWANNAGHGHGHARAWLDAGWRTRNLDRSTGVIEFVRIGPPTRRLQALRMPTNVRG